MVWWWEGERYEDGCYVTLCDLHISTRHRPDILTTWKPPPHPEIEREERGESAACLVWASDVNYAMFPAKYICQVCLIDAVKIFQEDF